MFGRARILLAIAACTLATPAVAQAPTPTTTAFDGTYIGVSRTLESTMLGYSTRQCPPNGRPGIICQHRRRIPKCADESRRMPGPDGSMADEIPPGLGKKLLSGSSAYTRHSMAWPRS